MTRDGLCLKLLPARPTKLTRQKLKKQSILRVAGMAFGAVLAPGVGEHTRAAFAKNRQEIDCTCIRHLGKLVRKVEMATDTLVRRV